MVDVSTEILIQSSQKKVAEYAVDPDNAPKWYVNIKSVEWKTPKPLAVGTRIAFKAQFLGRPLGYVYEIVEWVPLQKLVMRTTDGPFPMETTYIWEAVSENQTRMRLRNRGNPSGFSKLISPFMEMAMRRANKKDLALLKKILEERN